MHLLTLAINVIDSIQLEHNERTFPRSSLLPPKKLSMPSKKPAFFYLGPTCVKKKVSNDSLMKLQIIFPENLIIAALDLIDRGSGK